jgi:hypothetical protein
MRDRKTATQPSMSEPPAEAPESAVFEARPPATAGVSRREVIKRTAGALLAAPLAGLPEAQSAGQSPGKAAAAGQKSGSPARAPLFFSKAEFALVDELCELIIPSDDHSPGARAAKVAHYIDRRLAEAFTEEPRKLWRSGLQLLEALSKEMHGKTLLQSTEPQRIALLSRIAQNEMNPKTPEENFFKELKARTAQAYYSSKIGIHQEMQYKGNTYQKEYAGFDAN